jgi:spore coat polysaccharide biosynthesis protein SpsF
MDISGKPMLSRVVERTRRARLLKDMVVATTTEVTDDLIVGLCQANGWSFFRGSEVDVLDRYYRAAQAHQADVVVRITSDCPLVDPGLVDAVIEVFLDPRENFDYVTNTLEGRSFPRGLDVEVIGFSALQRAWEDDKNPAWREHVTQYIRRHPELFRLGAMKNPEDYSMMRWTVDTLDDLELVRRIYAHFGNDLFSWRDVVLVLEKHPEWQAINRNIRQEPDPA